MGRKKNRSKQARPTSAYWLPAGPQRVRCSSCGFETETARAVETGWTSTKYVGIRYAYCPICGRPMAIRDEDRDTEPAG